MDRYLCSSEGGSMNYTKTPLRNYLSHLEFIRINLHYSAFSNCLGGLAWYLLCHNRFRYRLTYKEWSVWYIEYFGQILAKVSLLE